MSKNNYKGKGKPKNHTGSRKPKDEAINKNEGSEVVKSPSNPVQDYSPYNGSIDLVGRLNFSDELGKPVKHETINGTKSSTEVFPGVMSLRFTPLMLAHDAGGDAFNAACNKMYIELRKKGRNGTEPDYTRADLGLYNITMAYAYMFVFWVIRLIGISNTYNVFNKYLPRTLINACNVDFNDLTEHRSNLVSKINNFCNFINAYPILNIPLLTNWAERVAGYYMDDRVLNKTQFYLFNPAKIGIFGWDSEGKGQITMSDFVPRPSSTTRSLMKVSDICEYLDLLQLNINYFSDNCTIAGDMARSFSASDFLALPRVSEDIVITPQRDEAVLFQIKNAEAFDPNALISKEAIEYGTDAWHAELNYTQDAEQDIVRCDPWFVYSNAKYIPETHIARMDIEQPTPDQIMEITRMQVNAALIGNQLHSATDDTVWHFHSLGNMYINDFAVALEPVGFGSTNYSGCWSTFNSIYSVDKTNVAQMDRLLTYIHSLIPFDFSPLLVINVFEGDAYVDTIHIGTFVNYQNYHSDVLEALNELANWGLMSVPTVSVSK